MQVMMTSLVPFGAHTTIYTTIKQCSLLGLEIARSIPRFSGLLDETLNRGPVSL